MTAHGYTLRTPLAPFRTASTKVGRRYIRLEEGDKVVMATVMKPEHRSIFLASGAVGPRAALPVVEEISILSGVGKGVMGIKLEKDDVCLGGALIGNQNDALVVETSGRQDDGVRPQPRTTTGRGGKGFEAVKRTQFVRVVPPPIELVDWDQVEGREKPKEKAAEPQRGRQGRGAEGVV